MPYYQNPYQAPYQAPVPDQLAQFRQPYQPFQQPAQQVMPQMQPPQQTAGGIIWVQGEEGAKAYMVAPGNSVLLMDSENNLFFIKSTDASGMPQPLRIFDYTERGAVQRAQAAQQPDSEKYVTRQEFAVLQARIDALTAPKQTNRKSAPAKEDEPNA